MQGVSLSLRKKILGVLAAAVVAAPAVGHAAPPPTIAEQVMEAVNLDGLEGDITTILVFAVTLTVGFVAYKLIRRALNRS